MTDGFVITEGQRVLFIGDSITDAQRREDPQGLGGGYVSLLASWITAKYPQRRIEFLNRGNGGNTVPDLAARWREDCIDLHPDWVSIMVGINDTARQARGLTEFTVEAYESGYRMLLDQLRQASQARPILLDPFLIGGPGDRASWRPSLEQRIAVVHRLAREYETLLVKTDETFTAACEHRPAESWAPDAVHPTPPGHALIAQQWLAAVGA